MLEWHETRQIDSRDGSVSEASLTLSYVRLQARGLSGRSLPKGQFKATFNRNAWVGDGGAVVSLTGGAVFLDLPGLKGHRVGTYLMNEIIEWAGQWPEANVATIGLIENQALDADARSRRNRFYEQFGLEFLYSDPDRKAGRSLPIQVKCLNGVETWKQNIEEVDFLDHLVTGVEEKEERDYAMASAKRSSKEAWEAYSYTINHPIRHAAKVLWSTWCNFILICGFVLLLAYSIAHQYQ